MVRSLPIVDIVKDGNKRTEYKRVVDVERALYVQYNSAGYYAEREPYLFVLIGMVRCRLQSVQNWIASGVVREL